MSSNARNSHKDVARVGRAASQANKQPRGGDAVARQHDQQMAKINRQNDARNR